MSSNNIQPHCSFVVVVVRRRTEEQPFIDRSIIDRTVIDRTVIDRTVIVGCAIGYGTARHFFILVIFYMYLYI